MIVSITDDPNVNIVNKVTQGLRISTSTPLQSPGKIKSIMVFLFKMTAILCPVKRFN